MTYASTAITPGHEASLQHFWEHNFVQAQLDRAATRGDKFRHRYRKEVRGDMDASLRKCMLIEQRATHDG